VKIRPASRFDAQAISDLVLKAATTNKSDDFDESGWQHFQNLNQPAVMAERLEDPERFTLCFLDGDSIVGIITIKNHQKLDQLFVAERVRGRGIAKQLWNTAKQQCLQHGNPGNFWVRSSKMAIPIYERFGFIKQGERQALNGIAYQLLSLGQPDNPN